MAQDNGTTRPTIIAVAPNGARRVKADHPAIPLTADELGREAARTAAAGAAMIHLHVRDAAGAHLLDADAYRAATAAIRREAGADMIVQITTEAVGRYTSAEQIACVRGTEPEAVSIAPRELLAPGSDERPGADLLAWAHGRGIMVQYILYDAADVARFGDLRRRGVIPDTRHHVLHVLGRYSAGQQSDANDLRPFLDAQDALGDVRPAAWFVCAFGRDEAACALAAAALGGHARVGFENNMLRADGTVADGNDTLITQAAAGLAAIGRRPATGAEARAILSGGG